MIAMVLIHRLGTKGFYWIRITNSLLLDNRYNVKYNNYVEFPHEALILE